MLKQKIFINIVWYYTEHKKTKIMLNIENLGLVELNAQEQVEIEGGIWPLILIGLLLYSTNAY